MISSASTHLPQGLNDYLTLDDCYLQTTEPSKPVLTPLRIAYRSAHIVKVPIRALRLLFCLRRDLPEFTEHDHMQRT